MEPGHSFDYTLFHYFINKLSSVTDSIISGLQKEASTEILSDAGFLLTSILLIGLVNCVHLETAYKHMSGNQLRREREIRGQVSWQQIKAIWQKIREL